MPGTPSTIARYQISDVIGEGGMGTLYRAWDPKLDRQLAIKVLRGSDAELHQRFSQEARSVARLRHKHVVTIFDVGDYDGQPFIAMEYIQGETLAQLVRRRASLPLARKLELMEELCDGLAYAHRADVVHRDIKPANLMVDSEGALKILDFGIARLGEMAGMTQAGALLGTLNYMSPEQVAGRPANRRSDIFAVGVVFYELLAYRQAFPGGLDTGLFHRILYEPPPPLDPADGIGQDVSRILYRALEKAPENRYDDLVAMGKDLRAARGQLEALEAPTEAVYLPSPGAAVPATPKPASGRRFIDRDDLDRRRASQVQGYLDDARTQLSGGNYEAAIAVCEQALMLNADEPSALDLLDHARAAIEAAQQEQWLSSAEQDLKRGALTAAKYLIDKAAAVNPAAPRVSDLQRLLDEAVRQREAEQAREGAIKRATDRAEASLRNRSFKDALTAAEEILRLAPGHSEGEALRTRALEGLRAEVLEAERRAKQDRIAAGLTAVQSDIEAQRFEAALDRLRELKKTEGPVPAVVLAIQDAEAAYAAAQRARQIAQQVEDALAKASALLARSDRSGALSQVDAALALRPDYEAARQLRAKIQDAIRVETERIEEEARVRAREQAVAAALANARELRSHHAALEVLTEAQRLDPDHVELRRAIESRRAAIAEEERAQAQRIEAEKQARAREQAVAAALAKGRELRSHQAALEVLTEAQRLAPDHADLRRAIEARRAAIAEEERAQAQRIEAEKQARAREQAIAAAIGKARDARSHEAAIAVLSEALRLDPAHPELKRLIDVRRDAVDRERAATRRVDQIAAACRSIETRILRGELDQAQRELETAERTLGAGRDLDPLRQQLASARASREGPPPPPVSMTASGPNATVAIQTGSADGVRVWPAGKSTTSKTFYLWVGAAAVAVVTTGGYLAFIRRPPTPAVERASVEPAKPPVAQPTVAQPSPAPAVVPGSEPPPAVAPPSPPVDIEPKLAQYRTEARRAYDRNDRARALTAASNVLALDSQDAKIQDMLRDWWRSAQSELKRAHDDADAQGSLATRSSNYDRGVTAEQDARRTASANKIVDALPTAWRGAGLFKASADEARTAAAAAKPSPEPPQTPPTAIAPPLPVVQPTLPVSSPPATANPAPKETPSPPPATSTSARPPVVPSNAADAEKERDAIRKTLQLYAKAYTDRDTRAIKVVWPTVPATVQNAFRDLTKQDTSLRDDSISVQGTKATAVCTVRIAVVGRGVRSDNTYRRSFDLQKEGSGWIITNFQDIK